jgi:putative endonuclease
LFAPLVGKTLRAMPTLRILVLPVLLVDPSSVILRLDRRIVVRTQYPMSFYVYITTNRYHGTLYVGVTNDLRRRVWEHKEGLLDGFTKTYGLKILAYYETFPRISDAIHREKRLKHWNRAWKIDLIESMNPGWEDLNPMFA